MLTPDLPTRLVACCRILPLLVALGAAPLAAQTPTNWLGTVSSNWFTAANWSAGVPTANSVVTIGTAPFSPNAGSATPMAVCRNLNVLATGGLQGRVHIIASATIDSQTTADLFYLSGSGTIFQATLSCGPTGRIRDLSVEASIVATNPRVAGCWISGHLALSGAMTADWMSVYGTNGGFSAAAQASLVVGSLTVASGTVFQSPSLLRITGGATRQSITTIFTQPAGVTLLDRPGGTVVVSSLRLGSTTATPGTTVRFVSPPLPLGTSGPLEETSTGATSFTSDDPVILEGRCFFDNLSVRDCTVVPTTVMPGLGSPPYQGGYPTEQYLRSVYAGSLEVRGTMTVPGDNGHARGWIRTGGGVVRGNLSLGAHAIFDLVSPFGATSTSVFHVDSGASMALGAYSTMRCQGRTTVSGTLQLAGGARWQLTGPLPPGPAGVQVNPGGALRLLGAVASPPFFDSLRQLQRPWGHHLAQVDGGSGLGWQFQVHGLLEAQRCAIRNLPASGLELRAGSMLGAAPYNFSGGVLGPAAGTGATILNVTTTLPVHADDVAFDNLAGTAVYNVTAVAGTSVQISRPSGNFFGAQHENDPANTISWGVPEVTIADVRALAMPGSGQVDMMTVREYDVGQFEMTSPALPAPAIWTPAGATDRGTNYSRAFTSTANYEVRELSRRGIYRSLGAGTGRLGLPPTVGPCVLVDPAHPSAFPTLAAAIAAVPTGGTVLVANGTFAGTVVVPRAMTIAARDANRFVIDGTGFGGNTVQVTAPAGHNVLLRGFDLRNATLAVSGQANVVVQDVRGVAATSAVLYLASAPNVMIDRCTQFTGMTANQSTAWLANSSVGDLFAYNSAVHLIGTPAPWVGACVGCTLTTHPGTMPGIFSHRAVAAATSTPIHSRGEPGSILAVAYGLPGFAVLPAPFDLPLLLDPVQGVTIFAFGLADALGLFTCSVNGPSSPTLMGYAGAFQTLSLDALGTIRFGGTTRITMLP